MSSLLFSFFFERLTLSPCAYILFDMPFFLFNNKASNYISNDTLKLVGGTGPLKDAVPVTL